RFYRSVYQRSYSALFDKLDRRGWLRERGSLLRVVDCGIGTGLLTTSLIGAVGRRLDLFGVDTSPGMLEHARARLRYAGTEPRLMLGDISRLPFEDREMDLVNGGLGLGTRPKADRCASRDGPHRGSECHRAPDCDKEGRARLALPTLVSISAVCE